MVFEHFEAKYSLPWLHIFVLIDLVHSTDRLSLPSLPYLFYYCFTQLICLSLKCIFLWRFKSKWHFLCKIQSKILKFQRNSFKTFAIKPNKILQEKTNKEIGTIGAICLAIWLISRRYFACRDSWILAHFSLACDNLYIWNIPYILHFVSFERSCVKLICTSWHQTKRKRKRNCILVRIKILFLSEDRPSWIRA